MKIFANCRNSFPYSLYSAKDNLTTDAKGQFLETLLGTFKGTKPQRIKKNAEATPLIAEFNEGFQIELRNPVGLKKSYILKDASNVKYVILNDPEPWNGLSSVLLIVRRLSQ
jgi:hypothetical protein